MRIAVTGASGYVGSAISQRLRDAGHEVLAWCRTPQASPWFHYALGDDPAGLPWQGVDVLIHAAHDFKPRDSKEAHQRNCESAEALFETARKNGVTRILFVSSMSAAAGCASIYGKAKLRLETAAHDIGSVVVRPGLVWGGPTGGVLGGIDKLVNLSPLVPFPDGNPRPRQFLVNREDLAEIISRILVSEPFPHGHTFILAHPQPLTLPEMILIIASRIGKRRRPVPVPWWLCQCFLKAAESLRLPLPVRSDSLLGLMHGTDEIPAQSEHFGVTLRPFSGI